MRSHKDYKWYYITTQFNWEGSAVYILVSLNSQKKSRKKVIYFLNLLLIINYLMLQWHLVIIYVSLRSTFQFFLFFLLVTIWSCSGSKGWCSGESTRLPPMWPGFKSRRRTSYVGWVCCWFSPLLREVFLRLLRFSPPQKPTFPNSNSTRNQVDEEPLCGCATSKSLFINLSINLFFNHINFSAFTLNSCRAMKKTQKNSLRSTNHD